MSTEDNDNISNDICANCGKDGNLKACTACNMVKYCNRDCQIAHRPQHKKECKKRTRELHDEKLFKQPPPDDCPICFLRMPSIFKGWRYQPCCGKVICSGCFHAPVYDYQGNKVNQVCPFCRVPAPTEEESNVRSMKRVAASDPIAIYNLGCYYRDGMHGFQQDHTKALEFYHRAAELGYTRSYCSIGNAYYYGRGVERDAKKASYYTKLAALEGDVPARNNLGVEEIKAGNIDRAIKHYIIAVRGGYADCLNKIKRLYSNGHATKDDYTQSLRAYQEYLGEIKSVQRDKAAAFNKMYEYY